MVWIKAPTHGKWDAFAAIRAVWTAPTTLFGRAVARLCGCGKPARIGGAAAKAWLYVLPPDRFERFGAIALGRAIIASPAALKRRGVWLLAHELSHTRQHDWLGPAYLPAHALCQLLSMGAYALRPLPSFTPWHAYNPLERIFICVPIDAVLDPPIEDDRVAGVLRAFGLAE
jgi:hypothetical protein